MRFLSGEQQAPEPLYRPGRVGGRDKGKREAKLLIGICWDLAGLRMQWNGMVDRIAESVSCIVYV